MCVSRFKDGVHTIKRKKKHTADALKLMKTQDLNYINSKRSMEAKVTRIVLNSGVLRKEDQEACVA